MIRLFKENGLSILRVTGANFRDASPIITKPLPNLESLSTDIFPLNLMGMHTVLTVQK
jgi:hypothetical protein